MAAQRSQGLAVGLAAIGLCFVVERQEPGLVFAGAIRPRAVPRFLGVGCKQGRGQHASEWRGVTWHENSCKWQAHLQDPTSGEPVSLGVYQSERDAAKAFDRASLAILGSSVPTNFPAESYLDADIVEEGRRLKNFWEPRPSEHYNGVYQTRGSSRWKAEISLYGVTQFLDYFQSEDEAARAFDDALRSTGAERASQLRLLNFRQNEDYFDEETWEDEPIPRGATSCFLGVTYHQPTGKYLARVGRRHVGLFQTEIEAGRAFDEASYARGGPTNFPPSDYVAEVRA